MKRTRTRLNGRIFRQPVVGVGPRVFVRNNQTSAVAGAGLTCSVAGFLVCASARSHSPNLPAGLSFTRHVGELSAPPHILDPRARSLLIRTHTPEPDFVQRRCSLRQDLHLVRGSERGITLGVNANSGARAGEGGRPFQREGFCSRQPNKRRRSVEDPQPTLEGGHPRACRTVGWMVDHTGRGNSATLVSIQRATASSRHRGRERTAY